MSRTDGGDPGIADSIASMLAELAEGTPGSDDGDTDHDRGRDVDGGVVAGVAGGAAGDGAGGADGGGEPARHGDAATSDADEAIDRTIDELLSRPEIAERLSRRTELHTRQLSRLFKRAVAGDDEALRRLLDDRNGRVLWESHTESIDSMVSALTREELERLDAWRMLLELRDTNPAAYAAHMRSREWFEFAHDMMQRYGDDLNRIGRRYGSALASSSGSVGMEDGGAVGGHAGPIGQGTAARDRGQPAGRDAARTDLSVWRLYDRLMASDHARVLSDRDREELDPEAFADLPPMEAVTRMVDRFVDLVRRRSGAGSTGSSGSSSGSGGSGMRSRSTAAAARSAAADRTSSEVESLKAELAALRRATSSAPPSLPGGTSMELTTDEEDEFLDVYGNVGAANQRLHRWYGEYRRRKYGWQ